MENEMDKRPTWELKMMEKALTSLPLLNSQSDNERLEAVQAELAKRQKSA